MKRGDNTNLANLSDFGRAKCRSFLSSMLMGQRDGMVRALSEMVLEGNEADAVFAYQLASMLESSLAARVYRHIC